MDRRWRQALNYPYYRLGLSIANLRLQLLGGIYKAEPALEEGSGLNVHGIRLSTDLEFLTVVGDKSWLESVVGDKHLGGTVVADKQLNFTSPYSWRKDGPSNPDLREQAMVLGEGQKHRQIEVRDPDNGDNSSSHFYDQDC